METYNDSYLVYVHLNKTDGKCYVGVTKKKNPNGRWHNGNGYSYNPYFYRAIQKYGWDGFEHIIFASNLTKEEASNAERLLILKLKSDNVEFGYNLCSGGYDCQGLKGQRNPMYGKRSDKAIEASIASRTGKHLTEEHKQKISKGNKGRIKTETERINISISQKGKPKPQYLGGGNPHAKSVLCVETNVVYDTITEAAKSINVNPSAITQAIRNNTKSKGFHWIRL